MTNKKEITLKMPDGAAIETLEELRDRFDINCMLFYYHNGSLVGWLENKNYNDEAEKIKNLKTDPDDWLEYDLQEKLYEIFGVTYFDYNKKYIKYLTKNAEQGSMKCQYDLGRYCCTLKGRVCGGFSKAVKLFKKAASQGHVAAMHSLGECYYHGRGVNWDKKEALLWFRKAADKDFAESQWRLGIFYFFDEQNLDEAIKWFTKAANQGHADAQNKLSICYLLVETNKTGAMKRCKRAAKQGDADAQYKLGVCYYYGYGVEKNDMIAYKWCKKAAEQGHPKAQYELKKNYIFRKIRQGNYIFSSRSWRRNCSEDIEDD